MISSTHAIYTFAVSNYGNPGVFREPMSPTLAITPTLGATVAALGEHRILYSDPRLNCWINRSLLSIESNLALLQRMSQSELTALYSLVQPRCYCYHVVKICWTLPGTVVIVTVDTRMFWLRY